MNVTSDKGFALVMVMVLFIILAISAMSLLVSAEHLARESKLQEPRHTSAYYTALAGLRYGAILSTTIFTTPAHNGEEYTVPGTDPIFDDLEVNSTDLTITIKEWSGEVTDPEWNNGEYYITAVFSY